MFQEVVNDGSFQWFNDGSFQSSTFPAAWSSPISMLASQSASAPSPLPGLVGDPQASDRKLNQAIEDRRAQAMAQAKAQHDERIFELSERRTSRTSVSRC